MKYKLKLKINDTEHISDLYFTDALPNIVNKTGKQFDGSKIKRLTGGRFLCDCVAEKEKNNTDLYKYKNNKINKNGNINSVLIVPEGATEYGLDPDNYNLYVDDSTIRWKNTYLMGGEGNSYTMWYDFDNDRLNTVNFNSTNGLILKTWKKKKQQYGLDGWNLDYYSQRTDCFEQMTSMTTAPASAFMHTIENDGELKDSLFELEEEEFNSGVKSKEGEYVYCSTYNILLYLRNDIFGSYDGYSLCQDDDYYYILNHFKYAVVRCGDIGYLSNDPNNSDYKTMVTYPPNCDIYCRYREETKDLQYVFMEDTTINFKNISYLVRVDKRTGDYVCQQTKFNDINNSYTFPAFYNTNYSIMTTEEMPTTYAYHTIRKQFLDYTPKVDDSIDCIIRLNCADDEFVYMVGENHSFIDPVTGENTRSTLYKFSKSLFDQPNEVIELIPVNGDNQICHTINRNNFYILNGVKCQKHDIFGLFVKDGIANFSTWFNHTIIAIAHFNNIAITSDDTVNMEIIEDFEEGD